jgi:hypothetical protein
MTTNQTYTGSDTVIEIGLSGQSGKAHSDMAIADYSITLERGTVTQELVGETGDMNMQGALSCEGSLTAAKLGPDGASIMLRSIISGNAATRCFVSGQVGANSVGWYFDEVMITGFEISMGDAGTVSEGSIDFQVMNPKDITLTKDNDAGTWIKNI